MNVPLPKYAERGPIHDVVWIPLKFFHDSRGWLVELFRNDLVAPQFHPVMAYVSMTKPGVARGPHEHVDQADYFCFTGPSTFRVYLWDARKDSPTFGAKEVRDVGEDAPYALIVPAGRGPRVQERRRQGRAGVQRRQPAVRRLAEAGPGGRDPPREGRGLAVTRWSNRRRTKQRRAARSRQDEDTIRAEDIV